MIIDFADEETRKICEDERYALKVLSRQSNVEKLKDLLYQLDAHEKFTIFRYSPLGKRYDIHELHKDKKFTEGTISLKITNKIRLTVKIRENKETDTILVLEVTYHYGD